jgi:hypothetical protein
MCRDLTSFALLLPQFQPANGEGSDRLRVHSVQDFSPNDFRGQRLDVVRAEVPGDAPSELRAVQEAKGTRDQGASF